MDSLEKICEAALSIAARDGPLSLTIDRVAEEAGLSKGGVTHHFGSKDELLQGMVKYVASQVEAHLATKVADDSHSRFRWFRALIDSIYPRKRRKKGELSVNRLLVAVLTVAMHNRELVKPMKELAAKMQQRLLDDHDGELDQLLIWLALDGLFLWEYVGLIKQSDDLHKRILSEMRERISCDE